MRLRHLGALDVVRVVAMHRDVDWNSTDAVWLSHLRGVTRVEWVDSADVCVHERSFRNCADLCGGEDDELEHRASGLGRFCLIFHFDRKMESRL